MAIEDLVVTITGRQTALVRAGVDGTEMIFGMGIAAGTTAEEAYDLACASLLAMRAEVVPEDEMRRMSIG